MPYRRNSGPDPIILGIVAAGIAVCIFAVANGLGKVKEPLKISSPPAITQQVPAPK